MTKNVVQQIRRATRRQFTSEEKIRIVLEGLRGEISVAEFCRREGISVSSPDQRQDRTVSPVVQGAGEPRGVGDAGGIGS